MAPSSNLTRAVDKGKPVDSKLRKVRINRGEHRNATYTPSNLGDNHYRAGASGRRDSANNNIIEPSDIVWKAVREHRYSLPRYANHCKLAQTSFSTLDWRHSEEYNGIDTSLGFLSFVNLQYSSVFVFIDGEEACICVYPITSPRAQLSVAQVDNCLI